MKVLAQEWIAIAGGVIGLAGFLDSAVQRYNKATTSRYAAERDFAHLKRNQEQIKELIKILDEENERAKVELITLRTQFDTLLRYLEQEKR